ncbi:MAG: hypothetical protein Alpg2KO_08030 [Alphaproteobacteria bacterium]
MGVINPYNILQSSASSLRIFAIFTSHEVDLSPLFLNDAGGKIEAIQVLSKAVRGLYGGASNLRFLAMRTKTADLSNWGGGDLLEGLEVDVEVYDLLIKGGSSGREGMFSSVQNFIVYDAVSDLSADVCDFFPNARITVMGKYTSSEVKSPQCVK